MILGMMVLKMLTIMIIQANKIYLIRHVYFYYFEEAFEKHGLRYSFL